MPALNYLAIAAASIVAFVVSSIYYIVLTPRLAQLSPAYADAVRPPAWKIIQEPIRTLITATVIAALARLLGIADVVGAVELALALWVGFPMVLLAGSVIHENVPWKLAAIHAGDWLLKLLIVTLIVSLWR
jgi:uncharacterized PurR-regulated membrane protein YhhQ (DUF165 family)